MFVWAIKMLQHKRIDISEGIDFVRDIYSGVNGKWFRNLWNSEIHNKPSIGSWKLF